MDKRTYLVITAIINKEHFAEVPVYMKEVVRIFAENGGKPLGRYKTIEKLSGDGAPETMAILEFSNQQTIDDMIDSEEYKSLADVRERIFDQLNMVICEDM